MPKEQTTKPPAREVRPANAKDIAQLNKSMPSPINEPQMAEQMAGDTTFLLAFDGDDVVGRLVIRWAGTTKDAIRHLVPATPNIGMVRTRTDQRGRGIGNSLMQAAEDLVRDRGYTQVGLGVALENQPALRLYQRLGYQDWGHGTYQQARRKPDPNGETEQTEIYLIKKLV